ncbi:UDP-N-acetylglucosamine transporter-like [Artemia franciscana]|uniref:UDP-N-acetylglucosamine transporter-like n=1 Tax=Artemia franciscana TaxID=6661 RepID=UPI0032DA4599
MTNTEVNQYLKYGTLALVTFQTTFNVLLLRYSRLEKSSGEGKKYFGSTLVLMVEIVKFIVCFSLLVFQNGWVLSKSVKIFYKEIISNIHETRKLSLPSALYTLQNTLLIVAISNLDVATFQLTYQLKILTTAFFSVLLLGKHLSGRQWVALFILMTGVICVQLPTGASKIPDATSIQSHQKIIGLVAVLISCLSSGFAGVFYEKLLKHGNQKSIIIRSLQLGLFSLISGSVAVMLSLQNIREFGFFFGYTPVIWTIVCVQAFGGLVIAATMKYADNILKGFATSISIILSSICSYLILNDFKFNVMFIIGALMVICATYFYGISSKQDSIRSPDMEELIEVEKEVTDV